MVAYECLTGEAPFDGEPLAVALAHLQQAMPPLPPSVPAAVAALVADLTAKDPAARPRRRQMSVTGRAAANRPSPFAHRRAGLTSAYCRAGLPSARTGLPSARRGAGRAHRRAPTDA